MRNLPQIKRFGCCLKSRKNIRMLMLQFPILLLPLSSRGIRIYKPCLWSTQALHNQHLWKGHFIKEMRSAQKKQNNSLYSVSPRENLNSSSGEIKINALGKGGERIRWKVPSTFATWQQLLPSPQGSLLLMMHWRIHLNENTESHQTWLMCNARCV